jgi:phosphatidylserine/phosphatidylglycerophosphate/cardiolipin synthase-like enzyme
MRSVKHFYILASISISILICVSCHSFPADIKPVNDSAYFKTVYSLISNAQKSVYVIMYHTIYYEKYPDSLSNRLVKSLVAARKRGVDVRVIMDRMGKERKTQGSPDNEDIAKMLSAGGVKVYMDDEKVTTHSKLLVVDSRFTVVGSTNWSYQALNQNNETNALIDSEQVAKEYIKYFDDIVTLCK